MAIFTYSCNTKKIMKEDIITFKTAKLAKKKGFDWKCHNWYWVQPNHDEPTLMTNSIPVSNSFLDYDEDNNRRGIKDCEHPIAPTQALLAKWLRDVHDIYVEVLCCTDKYNRTDGRFQYAFHTIGEIARYSPHLKEDYEEALEAGLQESLELLDIEHLGDKKPCPNCGCPVTKKTYDGYWCDLCDNEF